MKSLFSLNRKDTQAGLVSIMTIDIDEDFNDLGGSQRGSLTFSIQDIRKTRNPHSRKELLKAAYQQETINQTFLDILIY